MAANLRSVRSSLIQRFPVPGSEIDYYVTELYARGVAAEGQKPPLSARQRNVSNAPEVDPLHYPVTAAEPTLRSSFLTGCSLN